jgi:hypothetical protein
MNTLKKKTLYGLHHLSFFIQCILRMNNKLKVIDLWPWHIDQCWVV